MDTHLPDDTLMAPRFLFDAVEVGPEIQQFGLQSIDDSGAGGRSRRTSDSSQARSDIRTETPFEARLSQAQTSSVVGGMREGWRIWAEKGGAE